MTSHAFLRSITICLMSLLLGACQTLVRESIPGDWVEIPPGSVLRLNQPVQIPVGQARAFFAGNRSSVSGTSCALEVRRLDHERIQTVAAGLIGITRVQDYVSLVSRVEHDSGLDGKVRFQLAGHGDSGGGAQIVRFGYHFWLDDRQNPNLMRLTCLGWSDEPASTRPPTLVEIQAALGDRATLELVDAPSAP